jgi:hypothetical protein
MAGKNWQIEGRYVEYCSCDHGCLCETMADPTYGYCTGLIAFKSFIRQDRVRMGP